MNCKTALFAFSVILSLALPAEVNVFVGTAGVGHVTPAACAPFGMVQAGPDTSTNACRFVSEWAHTCGYQHGDEWCWRFSQTHVSGTGCISFGDFGLMPFTDGASHPTNSAAKMIKSTETAAPGRYAVTVERNGLPIKVEIAALARSVAYRLSYPQGRRAKLLVDLDWGDEAPEWYWADCWGRRVTNCTNGFPTAVEMRAERDMWSWNDYHIAMAAAFSRPVVSRRLLIPAHGVRGSVWELDFGELPAGELEIRMGLSFTSASAAAANRDAEMPRFDFDGTVARSARNWEEKLSRITIDTDDATLKANFESALYRTMMQPNLISDVGAPRRFSTFSLWDTFRAAHPLYTLIAPEYVDDFINSMLEQFDRVGYLPIWALGGSENHCMIGHHAVPVIVDAWLKGFHGFDPGRAYTAIRESLTKNHRPVNRGTWGLTKEDWDLLDRYGYYPYDLIRGKFDFHNLVARGESVSRTLECAYDAACAARMARAVGRNREAKFFDWRARTWQSVFDERIGFMRGKNSRGEWREPFDPYALGGGPWTDNDFCEGNSWQYTWHVMQDPKGLIMAMGGRDKFIARLQELFEQPPHEYADRPTGDVTGLIGQYAHGNEPSHHVIYFFTLAGRPDLAAKYIRKVFATQYFPTPEGLCGNDDCGQMAAWYVFSALGFYPFDPCGGEYVIGCPQIKSAAIRFPNGKRLVIRNEIAAPSAPNAIPSVRSATLDGKPVKDLILRHADLVKGGELIYR